MDVRLKTWSEVCCAMSDYPNAANVSSPPAGGSVYRLTVKIFILKDERLKMKDEK